ncbi:ribosomal protein S7 [Endogone sp. FLAS-F59071]|nr:ribosomal protein S7 [Endogone sp. FLAS-F59071]|eukprot:RUS17319.1 ribosomal protein S7 [Endogone sp. FLAS-F59071]
MTTTLFSTLRVSAYRLAVNSAARATVSRYIVTESIAPLANEDPAAPDAATISIPLREDPLVSQLVNTIMKDGKKARSQRLVSDALHSIRRQTNSDPYIVLEEAIRLAQPVLKLSTNKKGSKVLYIPTPLNERQRRHRAIKWITEAAKKRPEKVFEERLAGELLSVVNGQSSVLAKKQQLHKQGLANRANAMVSYNQTTTGTR